MFWIFLRFFSIIWQFIGMFSNSFWFIIEKASYVFTIGFYIVKLIKNFRASKKSDKKLPVQESDPKSALPEKKIKTKRVKSKVESESKKRKIKK